MNGFLWNEGMLREWSSGGAGLRHVKYAVEGCHEAAVLPAYYVAGVTTNSPPQQAMGVIPLVCFHVLGLGWTRQLALGATTLPSGARTFAQIRTHNTHVRMTPHSRHLCDIQSRLEVGV
jgi:hypothetical protein